MCIIYTSEGGAPAGEDLFAEWDRAARSNRDGVGLAIATDRGVRVLRHVRSDRWADLVDRAWDDLESGPWMIHFRLGTHGFTSKANVHPFRVGPRLYLAHNGILPEATQKLCERAPGESDTAALARVLSAAPVTPRSVERAIRGHIGHSRVALLSGRAKSRGILHIGSGWTYHSDIGMHTSCTRPGLYRGLCSGEGFGWEENEDADEVAAQIKWERWLRGLDDEWPE